MAPRKPTPDAWALAERAAGRLKGAERDAVLRFMEAGKEHLEQAQRLTLTLARDEDPTSPADCDGTWMLYSLDDSHAGSTGADHYAPGTRPFRVREEVPGEFLDDDGAPQDWLKERMAAGLAWPLRAVYREEPWEMWDPEDGVPDGFLVWEEPEANMGAKTPEARRKDAEGFLATWNAWACGEVYGYTLEDGNGEHVGSCWGFYAGTKEDLEHFAASIREEIPKGARVVKVAGDRADLAGALGFKPGVGA